MKNKLKTLEEHNTESSSRFGVNNYPNGIPNGIACPDCGEELVDTRPRITLLTNPPKKNTGCLKCEYVGYRFI